MNDLQTAQRLKDYIEELKQRLYRAKANIGVQNQNLKSYNIDNKEQALKELDKLRTKKIKLEQTIAEKKKEWQETYGKLLEEADN